MIAPSPLSTCGDLVNDNDDQLGMLFIGDPSALVRLAEAGQLDVLLRYRHVIIVDELAYEAAHQFAAANPLDDPDRLRRWITEQVTAGRVSCPTTWIGETAAQARKTGSKPPFKGAVPLAVHDYFSSEEDADIADRGFMTFLIDDRPGFMRQRDDELKLEIVSTRSMLMNLGLPVD
jgi:hypothetical protein